MTHPPMPTTDAARRRAQRAWCLYDWANSAFVTSVVSALLPVYFARLAARELPAHQVTATWGYASAAALAVAAVLSPLVGALADRRGRRKPMLAACVALGALGTVGLALLPPGSWALLPLAYGVAFVAFAIGNVLYDALLAAVAGPHEWDRVSARGFAWGYLGGGALLAVNLAMVTMPARFGFADAGEATRASFATVAVWWVAFSLPLFRRVPEPAPPAEGAGAAGWRLGDTIALLRRHPDLATFLLAFWLYSDGIGTIVRMATLYGAEVGLGDRDLLGALLLVQVLGAPAALAFGRLAGPLGARGAILVGLAGYVVIVGFAFTLHHAWQFWALAAMVALVQGGTQALSRSLFASLVPAPRRGELFGFYSVSEKLAGIVGPLVFAVVAQVAHGGRWATLALLPMFVGGAWLLLRVDVARGAAAARAAEGTP